MSLMDRMTAMGRVESPEDFRVPVPAFSWVFENFGSQICGEFVYFFMLADPSLADCARSDLIRSELLHLEARIVGAREHTRTKTREANMAQLMEECCAGPNKGPGDLSGGAATSISWDFDNIFGVGSNANFVNWWLRNCSPFEAQAGTGHSVQSSTSTPGAAARQLRPLVGPQIQGLGTTGLRGSRLSGGWTRML
jgi:hypothetical protein